MEKNYCTPTPEKSNPQHYQGERFTKALLQKNI